MIEEFRNSIRSILYERVNSPLFGTLIVSWVVWNWKIIYLTIFISEDKIEGTRIDYILTNYANLNNIVWFPLLSTVALILIIPFVSTGALWVSLKFNKWKKDIKNNIEKTETLTVHQSIDLRKEINDQEVEMQRMLVSKNDKIQVLERQNQELLSDRVAKAEVDGLKKELDTLKNRQSLNGIFSGTWRNEFVFDNGDFGVETFEIRGSQYFVDDSPAFNLDMIDVDHKNGLVKFRKSGYQNDRELVNDLTRINDRTYRGVEDKNIIVFYSRTDLQTPNLFFTPYYVLRRIKANTNDNINFKVKNNTEFTIKVLNYTITGYFNMHKITGGSSREIKWSIPKKNEDNFELDNVDPLTSYFDGKTDPGIYDSEIRLEYLIEGDPKPQSITRIARLILS